MGGFIQHSTLIPKDVQSHTLGRRDTKKIILGLIFLYFPGKQAGSNWNTNSEVVQVYCGEKETETTEQ